MSSNQVWLALALVGTFLTIFMLGLVVDMALSTRRRYVSVLRTQVGDTAGSIANLRNDQLRRSALERLVLPFAGKVISSITRVTPLDLYGRVNRLIVLAGNPPALTAERIVAFKIVGGIAGLLVGLLMAPLVPFTGFVLKVGTVALFTLIGYTLPSAAVRPARRSARRRSARRCPTPWTSSRSALRPASASMRRSARWSGTFRVRCRRRSPGCSKRCRSA